MEKKFVMNFFIFKEYLTSQLNILWNNNTRW